MTSSRRQWPHRFHLGFPVVDVLVLFLGGNVVKRNGELQRAGGLLDLALEKQVVEKRGSWLNYKGTQLAQGRDAAKEVLKNDKALYEEIEAAVKAKLDEEKS